MIPIVWPLYALKLTPAILVSPAPLYVSAAFLNSTTGTSSSDSLTLAVPSCIPGLTSNIDCIRPAHARALVILIIRLASLISSTRICDM